MKEDPKKSKTGKASDKDKAPNVVEKEPRAKKKKKFVDTPEERVDKEMEKVMLLQARLAKKNRKPKKMRTVVDYSTDQAAGKRAYLHK